MLSALLLLALFVCGTTGQPNYFLSSAAGRYDYVTRNYISDLGLAVYNNLVAASSKSELQVFNCATPSSCQAYNSGNGLATTSNFANVGSTGMAFAPIYLSGTTVQYAYAYGLGTSSTIAAGTVYVSACPAPLYSPPKCSLTAPGQLPTSVVDGTLGNFVGIVFNNYNPLTSITVFATGTYGLIGWVCTPVASSGNYGANKPTAPSCNLITVTNSNTNTGQPGAGYFIANSATETAGYGALATDLMNGFLFTQDKLNYNVDIWTYSNGGGPVYQFSIPHADSNEFGSFLSWSSQASLLVVTSPINPDTSPYTASSPTTYAYVYHLPNIGTTTTTYSSSLLYATLSTPGDRKSVV